MKKLIVALSALAILSSFTYNSTDQTVSKDKEENLNQVVHRIKLCQYKKIVPIKMVESLRSIGGVTSLKTKKGSVYVTAPFENEVEAALALPKFQELGFEEAQQVVEVANQLVSIDEFHKHFDADGQPIDNGKPSVIRIWK